VTATVFQAEDIYRLKWVLDPDLSPDGTRLVYALKNAHPDDLEERYLYRLMILDSLTMPENGEGRRLAAERSGTIRRPRWSPDGKKLAFLCGESGRPQIWSLTLEQFA
jgi:Tol biopolymer transport system component